MSQPNRLRGVVVGGIALAGVLAGAAPVWSQTPRRAVFVVNNVSDEITAFTVNSDGTLNFVGTYATDRAPTPIAVAPGGAHLATANATDYDIELVTIFAVNPDASLSEVASTTFPNSPLSLVWINDLTVAVGESTIGSSKIHVYAFDPDLGTLTEIDQEPSGSFNTSLALSRDGRYLYAQDSSGYLIRWFAVQANGTLSFAGSVSTSGIYPLDLVITHDGTKLYAGGGISQGGHMVLGFAIDQETGQLTPLPGSPYYSPGASPAYTAVSTDDRYLFVGHGTDATVRTFAINADGSLTATGFFFDVGLQGTCGDLQTLGRLLFVTDESTAGDGITGLYSFAIAEDGSFTAVSGIYNTDGTRPESIATWTPPPLPGDMNCDATVDGFDIQPFVQALSDPASYSVQNPGCDLNHADVNGDGTIDGFDIQPFVELLTG